MQIVQQLHTQDLSGSDSVELTVVVLNHSEELRWTTVTDRMTKAQSQVPIVSVMLADSSGPILLELWRDGAENALRDLVGWSSASNDELVWVEVRYAWCLAIQGRVIPVVRKMVANERTTIVRCEPPAIPPSASPSAELYAVDFDCLHGTVPFTVCLRGTVTSVQEETISQAGNPVKYFKLHDQIGKFVHCVAFGRHVANKCIVECNDVVLYFANAVAGLNGASGQLWMFDESHIVVVGVRFSVPPAKICMELR